MSSKSWLNFAMLPACCTFAATGVASTPASSQLVFFGTYTKAQSQGIYVADFDAISGVFSPARLAAQTANPTFLALHPRLPILYTVGDDSEKKGAVSAYTFDRKTGQLTLLNRVTNGAGCDCHISVSPDGGTLFTANYHACFIASYQLNNDGSIGAQISMQLHTGQGPLPQQTKPHPHCVTLSPAGDTVFTADLGTDHLHTYAFDAARHSLTPVGTPFTFAPGTGPRHVEFHPKQPWFYVIGELGATLSLFAYDAASQQLALQQTVSTVPGDFTGQKWCAELAVHPSGNYLYASNRATHESIAVFAIDPVTGHLTFRQYMHEGIKHARHFTVTADGRWLLAASHDNNTVVTFRIDPASGMLSPHGTALTVLSPTCIVPVP